MTDRINSFLVILDHNYSDDDGMCIADAIRQLKGVHSVTCNVVPDAITEAVPDSRIRRQVYESVLHALYPKDHKS